MIGSKAEKWFALAIGVPIGVLIFYLYQLWTAPIPVETYERTVEPIRVTAGTEVRVTWTGRRVAECSSVTYRTLIFPDGRLSMFAPTYSKKKPVGENVAVFTFTVPELTTPGRLIYRVRVQYFCNWVQEKLGG